jgi:pyruvate kinase
MLEMDACFVARGDLALETDFCSVPIYQKMICKKALEFKKPVFIATQMLESLLSHPNPTRAEISDVANAVFDYADALTLSSETAIGNDPAHAVNYMNTIIYQTEEAIYHKKTQIDHIFKANPTCNFVINEKNNYIILYNPSIDEIRKISALRSNLLIYVVTNNLSIYRSCNFYWGIISILNED